MFAWVNRDYLEKFPPPADIEACYVGCLQNLCRQPKLISVHLNSFSRADPDELRSSDFVAGEEYGVS